MASLLTSGYFARRVQLGSLGKHRHGDGLCQPSGHMWLVLGLPLLSGVSYNKGFLLVAPFVWQQVSFPFSQKVT